ncbi:PP2C family serine/threonine-protein phosphatase [Schaalia sp. Marseille-Q2122]|uniref:PP2C family protein-serine/threonine phosphatase n=1 Tax=Schaalia sp. Marseille-Q2122 TaxID=2736604 RepID=UPI001589B72E|nr:protein phosphatase 2C domain-containing protein [Schaalia sp. Marseille-Q2122]
MASPNVEFRYAARSDIGLKRSSNQDSGYAGHNLLVLADGMGGAAGGDIASSVAVAHLAPLGLESHSADTLLPLLRQAFLDAHAELLDRSKREPELTGLGTTCIAILRSGNKLAMAHIGDSRAYLLRNGQLAQITTDHSFVQFLVSQGEITPEEALDHPQRNAVTKVLGYNEVDAIPDETVREAVEGDRWLLCSDGLSGLVSDETIAQTLRDYEDPGECSDALIDLALRAGGTDNVTCIVADVVPALGGGDTTPQIVGAAAVDRTAPSRMGPGAAGRAAALSTLPDATTYFDEDADTEEPQRARWWTPVISLIVAAIVLGSGWLGYTWAQTQFYVLGSNGKVVIYQGIPQSLGSWELSTPVEITEISLESLPQVERERLEEPVMRSSREEIDLYVEQLREAALKHAQHTSATTYLTPKTSSQSGATAPADANQQSGATQPGAAQSGGARGNG